MGGGWKDTQEKDMDSITEMRRQHKSTVWK